jgi:hypothetical protein
LNLNIFLESPSEISIVVKASLRTIFVKLLSSIARPFVREVFWFEVAHPQLKKLFPEIDAISPGTSCPRAEGQGKLLDYIVLKSFPSYKND